MFCGAALSLCSSPCSCSAPLPPPAAGVAGRLGGHAGAHSSGASASSCTCSYAPSWCCCLLLQQGRLTASQGLHLEVASSCTTSRLAAGCSLIVGTAATILATVLGPRRPSPSTATGSGGRKPWMASSPCPSWCPRSSGLLAAAALRASASPGPSPSPRPRGFLRVIRCGGDARCGFTGAWRSRHGLGHPWTF